MLIEYVNVNSAITKWLFDCVSYVYMILMLFSFLFSYMVDAADREKIEASRNELHNLLDKPQLQGIPVRGHWWFMDPKPYDVTASPWFMTLISEALVTLKQRLRS